MISRNLPKIGCMCQQAELCIIIMIIVWQNYFCACQGSGSHCGCGFDFGTASASGSGNGNGSRSDGTFHNLLHFMVVRWQTAQKSAAKIQMNSKLVKLQLHSRADRGGADGHCRDHAAGSETVAETAVSVTTTFDLKLAVRTRSATFYANSTSFMCGPTTIRCTMREGGQKVLCPGRTLHIFAWLAYVAARVCVCVYLCVYIHMAGVWCLWPQLLG